MGVALGGVVEVGAEGGAPALPAALAVGGCVG